jgi:hypothetical protein
MASILYYYAAVDIATDRSTLRASFRLMPFAFIIIPAIVLISSSLLMMALSVVHWQRTKLLILVHAEIMMIIASHVKPKKLPKTEE